MHRILLTLALAVLVPMAAHAVVLADGGRALATVVLPETPAPAETTAASELCDHLQKITGATFTVAVAQTPVSGPRLLVGASKLCRDLVGEQQVTALQPDEFIVKVVAQDLVLVGGSPRGTLYAVCSFLEDDLGCRWLTWYGDTDVPRRSRLEIGNLDRRSRPAFAVRDMCVQSSASVPIRPALIRFLARNRDQGPDMWFAGNLTDFGGTSHRYGRPPGVWMVHTFYAWMPHGKYFADHPDFYSLIGGKRTKAQLCFTNPELRRTMTANVLAGIGATDPAANYAVSAQDDDGPLCECPACQALADREGCRGAPLYDYLVELGAAVKQQYPAAYLTTLAYRKNQTEAPPRTIKLPDNVIIIFAPIDDNFAQAIDHPSNADTKKNISEWPHHTNHLWVWYYPNPYGTALPLGNLERMAADFRLFHQVGVEGIFSEHDTEGVYRSIGLANLQTWLMLKLMWDPDRDLAALIADFTDRYYGAAAPLIREFSSRLEADTRALPTRMSWNAPGGQYRHLTPALLVWSQRLFDRAEAAVAADPVLLTRVKQARMGMDLACVLNWEALKSDPQHGLQRAALIDRYRETYIATMRAHFDPKYVGDEVLKWQRAVTDLKPLPETLARVPAARIRQFTPQTARLHGKGNLVADPDAAAGIAAELVTEGKVPANLGYYDAVTRRQQHAYPGKGQPIVAGKYQLYPIGKTTLSEQCYVWFDWSWLVQFADVGQLYDPARPDKQWEIYASVKYEGAAYGGEGTVNRLRVDRLILVEVE